MSERNGISEHMFQKNMPEIRIEKELKKFNTEAKIYTLHIFEHRDIFTRRIFRHRDNLSATHI